MISEMGSGILVIPLIVLLEDIAICKAFSDGRTIDATQEMIALGVIGIANSFVQAYPGGGSLARSVVSNGSGVKTTFNGIYTGQSLCIYERFYNLLNRQTREQWVHQIVGHHRQHIRPQYHYSCVHDEDRKGIELCLYTLSIFAECLVSK